MSITRKLNEDKKGTKITVYIHGNGVRVEETTTQPNSLCLSSLFYSILFFV